MKLRNWTMNDARSLALVINNKKIQNNLRDGLPFPYTIEDARNYIGTVLEAEADKSFVYAIVDDQDKVMGNIGLFRQDNIHFRSAEMGYFVGEPYWGKGIATAAVQEICQIVFATTDIIRVFAEPFATNAASCRVLEKSGFKLEGVLLKNAYKNNHFLDMRLYALIKAL
ncbi:GNAT family N-acetyltransferase [Eubacteriaceae bacterium ES2]|nr:GNAT family N-acetyltransferase [Eubacteriaceae bacterium ES2]